MSSTLAQPTIGALLREWRQRRHLSQLALASGSAVSTRHLSFIETGRAQPSREMVLHLAEQLDVPLRERNPLLLAAGYAPIYAHGTLSDEEMAPIRDALDRFLVAHEPYPAAVVDRHWNLVAANSGIETLTQGVASELLEPPANVFRIALHPHGMASRILNFEEWSGHIIGRLRRQAVLTRDEQIERLYEELCSYPGVACEATTAATQPLFLHRLLLAANEISLFSTVTRFATATDVMLSELTIEAFYPADLQTKRVLTHGAT